MLDEMNRKSEFDEELIRKYLSLIALRIQNPGETIQEISHL